MKIKTSELIDEKLNWAVSEAEGCSYGDYFEDGLRNCRAWSTDWSQGGPIIEREAILFHPAANQRFMAFFRKTGTSGIVGFGETHLIAAMRAYVASKLGDEVEIPEELT